MPHLIFFFGFNSKEYLNVPSTRFFFSEVVELKKISQWFIKRNRRIIDSNVPIVFNMVQCYSNKLKIESFKLYIALLGTKHCQFCFRFLHRIVMKELRLHCFTDEDKCIYCSNRDSIEQTFIDCKEPVKLYSQIIVKVLRFTLTNEQIAFHNTYHTTN